MPIHFGTDGWRAVISDSFTFDNLRIVAQAIADAVASEGWDKSGNGGPKPDPKKIVVGFDTRFPVGPFRRRSGRACWRPTGSRSCFRNPMRPHRPFRSRSSI